MYLHWRTVRQIERPRAEGQGYDILNVAATRRLTTEEPGLVGEEL